MSLPTVAVVGMAVMGRNLALNLADRGHHTAIHNRSRAKADAVIAALTPGQQVTAFDTVAELAAGLARPRRIILMVQAGAAVDAVIDELRPHLEAGDVVIDGGNSHYADTQDRLDRLAGDGVWFVGAGISGEYGDMQVLAEAHTALNALGLSYDAQARAFRRWNEGRLHSYLIEITADILAATDGDGVHVLDLILDAAGQKGTGRWTVTAAMDVARPATLVAEAVAARMVSADTDLRRAASAAFADGHDGPAITNLDLDDVEAAVHAAKLISYAQEFEVIDAASAQWSWGLDALSSALAYFDGIRCHRSTANLIQAQRDYFGAHTYERVDHPRGESFHTDWAASTSQPRVNTAH